ncbi:MAG TPA: YciI family protein [Polyangiaceae bacterium]|nr:YciI family protein [Polyangiaceae bacterium]
MKFVLMMHAKLGTGDWDIFKWKPEEIQAHLAYWKSLNTELRDAGEFVSVEALAGPGEAKVVRVGKGGLPVTDGVFPETKEFLAGYWIVDVDSAERAYAIAAKASLAPGPGGKPMILPIEVRQVMQSPARDV